MKPINYRGCIPEAARIYFDWSNVSIPAQGSFTTEQVFRLDIWTAGGMRPWARQPSGFQQCTHDGGLAYVHSVKPAVHLNRGQTMLTRALSDNTADQSAHIPLLLATRSGNSPKCSRIQYELLMSLG